MSENINNQPYCNFKYLNKLPLIDDFDLECTVKRKIVLLTRNPIFKKKYRTSKTIFKKLSAEDMNKKALDASLTHCKNKFKPKKTFFNYSVIFLNEQGDIKEMMKLIKREVVDLVSFLIEQKEIKPHETTKHDSISVDIKRALIQLMVGQHRESQHKLLVEDPFQEKINLK